MLARRQVAKVAALQAVVPMIEVPREMQLGHLVPMQKMHRIAIQ